jgi:hypothetical protein
MLPKQWFKRDAAQNGVQVDRALGGGTANRGI